MDGTEDSASSALEHLERLASVFSGLVGLGAELSGHMDKGSLSMLNKTTSNVAAAMHSASIEVKALFQDED